MIFLCFGIFPFDRNSFFTFIMPGSRYSVQVVQTVQIDLQKFRFTARGSNLAFVIKKHRAQLLQDANKPCNRISYNDRVNYFVTFLGVQYS